MRFGFVAGSRLARSRRLAGACLATATLAACASVPREPAAVSPSLATQPPHSGAIPSPPPATASRPAPSAFGDLPGWSSDDHAAALRAFADACRKVQNRSLTAVCAQTLAAGPLDEPDARAFLERAFRPEPIAAAGLLTGYFAPAYPARRGRDGDFVAPVRPRPADLPRRPGPDGVAYAARAQIETRPAPDALAWMRPEDLFFLQTQGSGTLIFEDGGRSLAVSDGTNGAPFVGIAGPMRRLGLLSETHASAQAVRDWLAHHRGRAAGAVMDLDPRYVFFRLRPDSGANPPGAAGAPLTPGRAVAVDPASHAYGELLWIAADDPALSGARPSYRRLVIALDTGGAIRGAARADLYLGRGDAAGEEAGRVRHRLRLWRLRPAEIRQAAVTR